jgi:hypothetical protein
MSALIERIMRIVKWFCTRRPPSWALELAVNQHNIMVAIGAIGRDVDQIWRNSGRRIALH